MTHLDMFEGYVRERENGELLRHEHGFAIYVDMDSNTAYLQDVYVLPQYRKVGIGRQLLQAAMQKALNTNKSTLLTSTDIAAIGANESIMAILSCGFKIRNMHENMIWYSMELKRG